LQEEVPMWRWRPDGARAAAGALAVLALAVLLGPLLSRYAYWERVGPALQPPSAAHWLGTDEVGRDVLVRLLYAGRVSLAVGVTAALAAAVVGTAIGLLAGSWGGWVDGVLMRLTDVFLALPALPVLLILAAVDLAQLLTRVEERLGLAGWDLAGWADSAWLQAGRVVVVVALFGWMGTARLVRAQVASLRERPFVLAARASGVSGFRIAVRHLLPHCLGPVLVAGAAAVGGNILYEAVLGFLGLGVPPPTPSWGGMLHSARVYSYYRAPWLIYFPGLCITLTVFGVNLLADHLQEQADPRRR
jgi:peptide/nickel transport system permease protein